MKNYRLHWTLMVPTFLWRNSPCNACLTMHKETERCDICLWCRELYNRFVSVIKERRTCSLLLTSAVIFRNCELNWVLWVAMETNEQQKQRVLSERTNRADWAGIGDHGTCFKTSSMCWFIATRKRYFLRYKLETTINCFFLRWYQN
jgi:hypothetical protein